MTKTMTMTSEKAYKHWEVWASWNSWNRLLKFNKLLQNGLKVW